LREKAAHLVAEVVVVTASGSQPGLALTRREPRAGIEEVADLPPALGRHDASPPS
jgi:hypothetical protein